MASIYNKPEASLKAPDANTFIERTHDLPLVGNARGHPGDKYAAVDVEAGVRPGENALGPFRAQQLLADKHRQNLAGEDLRQPRVVDPRDLMEDARTHEPFPVHEYRRNAASSVPPSVTRKWRCMCRLIRSPKVWMVNPLGMTRWAESPGAAREHDEPLLGAVRTPDAGSVSQSS